MAKNETNYHAASWAAEMCRCIAELSALPLCLLAFAMPCNGQLISPYNTIVSWDADSESAVDATWEPHRNPLGGAQVWTWSASAPPLLQPVYDFAFPGLGAAFMSGGETGAVLTPGSLEVLPLDPSNGAASIELWFRPSSLIGGPQLLASFGGSTTGGSLTLDNDVLRFQVRQSDVRGGIDLTSPPDGIVDDGLEDLVAVVSTRLRDTTRFAHVVATIETGGSAPRIALYVDGVLATPLNDSGTGLFKDETLIPLGRTFLPTSGTQGQNPLATSTSSAPPSVATIAITDWSGPATDALLRSAATIGGHAGPGGGPLDLTAFRNRGLTGEIAVFNLYSRALNDRQVAVLFRQIAAGETLAPPAGELAGLALSYDAAIGALSGGEDWENRYPVNLNADLPGDALDWKFGRSDGGNLVNGVSAYPGIRAAYVFSAEANDDDGVLSARRSDGSLANCLAEILEAGIDRSSVSIELWFKPSDLAGKEVLVETGGTTDGMSLRLNGSDLELAVRNGTNPDPAAQDGLVRASLAGVDADEFIQAVGVIDLASARLRLYVNGAWRAGASFLGADWDGGDAAALGAYRGGLGGDQGTGFGGFTGQIAILRLYNRVLSGTEVAANFATATVSPLPPNIIVMMADDMGFGDTSAYLNQTLGPTAAPTTKTLFTPNLERLAAQGLLFTDVHAGSTSCSPSRYALLTGRYAWRTYHKHFVIGGWGSAPLIAPARPTLASLLKDEGYRTAAFGKWHQGFTMMGRDGLPISSLGDGESRWSEVNVGEAPDGGYVTSILDGPLAHGFEYFFGLDGNFYIDGGGAKAYIENNSFVGVPTWLGAPPQAGVVSSGPGVADWDQQRMGEHYLNRVLDIIDAHVTNGRTEPFFFYYVPNANHDPHDPAVSIRVQGQAYPVRDQSQFTDGSDGGVREDMVYENDLALGLLLDKLAALNDPRTGRPLRESTLLIFTSDNGGTDLSSQMAGLRDRKASLYEGGHRVPFIVAWPGGGVPAGAVSRASFGLVDLYSSFAALLGHGLGLDEAEDSANVLPALTGQVRGAEFQRSRAMVFHDDNWLLNDLPDDALLSIREAPYVMQSDGQLVNDKRLSGADRGRAVPIKLYDLDADLHQDEDLLGLPEHEARVDLLAQQLLRYHNRGYSRPLGLGAGQILHTDGAWICATTATGRSAMSLPSAHGRWWFRAWGCGTTRQRTTRTMRREQKATARRRARPTGFAPPIRYACSKGRPGSSRPWWW